MSKLAVAIMKLFEAEGSIVNSVTISAGKGYTNVGNPKKVIIEVVYETGDML